MINSWGDSTYMVEMQCQKCGELMEKFIWREGEYPPICKHCGWKDSQSFWRRTAVSIEKVKDVVGKLLRYIKER